MEQGQHNNPTGMQQSQHNTPPQAPAHQSDDHGVERPLLVLLFLITFFQFAMWATQSVQYLLHSAYGTAAATTPLDFIVGLLAMIAAGLVFTGAAMWWKKNQQAEPFILIGAVLFMIKNVFDVINVIWVFNLETQDITESAVNQLAASVGNELFQLAFWVFVFFFFRYRMRKQSHRTI